MRTLLLVPYSLPAFISVLVWKGLLNEQLGVVNKTLVSTFGLENGPKWTSDDMWVKAGILLIQLWLGFPYMMLICTGALQSIPNDIYEAARVDGANVLQQFRHLTLPLLLVAVGPLLIASFAFNFNNFTIVELFNKGGPPISPDTPAGYSDILITYTYELAFGSGRGADYGFAATISLVIFFIVAVITFFNFRFTRTWEEISENV
jgi:ABC-type sugar transport system permease subunit